MFSFTSLTQEIYANETNLLYLYSQQVTQQVPDTSESGFRVKARWGRGDAHSNFSSNQRIISGKIYLLCAILESGSSPLNLSLAPV